MSGRDTHNSAGASSAAREVRFLIVDDQPVVTFALRHLLSSKPGWGVVDHVATLEEARASIEKLRPDVVLLDMVYPEAGGYEFLSWVYQHAKGVRSIVYSIQPSSIYARRCVQAGAAGYVGKESSIEDMLETVRLVVEGHTVVCGSVYDASMTEFVHSRPARELDVLSRRELEVLNLLGQGLSNKLIAKYLCRSAKTVESHRYRISRKLGVPNGPELVEFAARQRMSGGFEGVRGVDEVSAARD